MRSELISAELYAIPAVVSDDSRRISLLCGEHILTHSLKTGKLIQSSEALGAKPTRVINRGSELIISSESGSIRVEQTKSSFGKITKLGDFQVQCVAENIAVVTSVSTEPGHAVLGYIQGALNADSSITAIYTGPVSSFGCTKSQIAAIVGADRRTLFVYDTVTGTSQEYMHNKPLTSLAVHPSSSQFAVGDLNGRIMRFSSNLKEYTSLHHWHSVSVASLVYTANGSMLLSGAEEGVLCIWNESSSDNKPQFIPRLGGPIAHICVSNSHQFAVVSLKSNRVVVIDLFTRSIQSSIAGTLNDGDDSSVTRINQFASSQSLVVLSTPSHAQLFDMDSRRAVNKTPIPIQERNHIPATVRAKLKARPWECQHLAVLKCEKGWFLMASLSRRHSATPLKKIKQQQIKFFESNDSGITWNLHTVCMGAHTHEIVGIEAVPSSFGFVSAAKDGTMKLWQMSSTTDSVTNLWKATRTVSFKNRTPTFVKVSNEGIIIAGFEHLITLWNPRNLVELTSHGLQLTSPALHADIIPGTTTLMALSDDGTCSVWDLKRCKMISSLHGCPTAVASCLVGSRLLVSSQVAGEIVAVTYIDGKKSLKIEHIPVGGENIHKVDQISRCGLNCAVIGSNKGKLIHRLVFDDLQSDPVPFRDPDELEADDMVDDIETEADSPSSKPVESRKPMIQMNSLMSKLFPPELALDSLGSPETQFESFIAALDMH